MKVQVLYLRGCPNRRPTVELVNEVISKLELDVLVEEEEVQPSDDFAQLKFFGSPTVLVDGVDIDPAAQNRRDYGMSCRTYVGSLGVPPRDMIVAALSKFASAAQGCYSDGTSKSGSVAFGRAAIWVALVSVVAAIVVSVWCWLPKSQAVVVTDDEAPTKKEFRSDASRDGVYSDKVLDDKPVKLKTLSEGYEILKKDFNAAHGSARLILIVSPG